MVHSISIGLLSNIVGPPIVPVGGPNVGNTNIGLTFSLAFTISATRQ